MVKSHTNERAHIQPDPDDGLLDLCIAHEVSRARIFSLIPHFLGGTEATQEPIRTGWARRVLVTAVEGVLPAHADGRRCAPTGDGWS